MPRITSRTRLIVYGNASNWRVTGVPQRLTSGTGLDVYPSLTADRRLLFSAAGRLLAYGYFCLWARQLIPDTKRPIGEPMSIAHFHRSRLSMGNIGFSVLGIAVARDKIVFNLGEITGNIWVTPLPN